VNVRRLPWKWIRLALVAAILALAVRFGSRLDGRAILAAAAGANPLLLTLSGVGNLPLIWTKARRMNRVLAGRISSLRLMGIYVTSYAADNLVMSQAGLGLRIAYFRLNGIPLATSAAAQFVEKALEAIGLGLVAGPFLRVPGAPAWLARPVFWCVLAAVIVLGAAMALLPRARSEFMQRLGAAAVELRRPRVALEVVALTVAGWLLEALMVIVTLEGMHLTVPLASASALVLLAVNMAALVPGLPANLGTFEVSCTLALGVFGVPPARALSFTLVYHALHTIPVTLVGAAVQRYGIRPPKEPDTDERALAGTSGSSWEGETSTSTTNGR
jgi:uncharacterized membrane protein YbhN (UPF0104 family)